MAAKKKSTAKKKQKATKKPAKNSLVANINKRKRAGTSRPKSRSTVSKKAYGAMEEGWPKSGAAKKKRSTKKRAPTSKK